MEDPHRACGRDFAETLASRYPQGEVSGERLASYLDEYRFRFNRRTSNRRSALYEFLAKRCPDPSGNANSDLSAHQTAKIEKAQHIALTSFK